MLNYHNHQPVTFRGKRLFSTEVEAYQQSVIKQYLDAGMEEPAFEVLWNGEQHTVKVLPPPPKDAPIRKLADAWQMARGEYCEGRR